MKEILAKNIFEDNHETIEQLFLTYVMNDDIF